MYNKAAFQLLSCKPLLTLLLIGIYSLANAQFLLNIDGETPDPFSDKTGNNVITFAGLPVITNNAVEFPTGVDYLVIDPFVDFDLDEDWIVSFDISVDSIMDSIYVIDWRSASSTGHMHIAYNGQRGMYFSDRNLNGIYGSLVADTTPLPPNTFVHFDVSRKGDSLLIDRNQVQVASAYLVDALSPLSTTTIGYSEDFRYQHGAFRLDNLTLTATPILSIRELNAFEFGLYPNPVKEQLFITTSEKIRQLKIFSILGKEMLVANDLQKTILNISELPSGIYILELLTEKGVSVKRFTKS